MLFLARRPPHQTPIVLGAVFFRAFNVLFDNARASDTVPPTIGFAKQNKGYSPVGISNYQVEGKGSDGDPVHRVYVQHKPIKVVNGVEKVGVANPNGEPPPSFHGLLSRSVTTHDTDK